MLRHTMLSSVKQSRRHRAPKIMRRHMRRMSVEPLEDRLLLAGDSIAVTPLVAHESSDAEFGTQESPPVLVFVDSAVEGYQDLIGDLLQPADTNPSAAINASTLSSPANVAVVILDGDRDGIAQISETLSQYADLSTIHVLSHGSSGSLQLGNTRLDRSNLDDYAAQLSAWGESLVEGADILLYGCNVADGTWGIEFVEDLAGATAADVAASDNLTGTAMLGGDWVLETSTGPIESPVLFATRDYPGVLYDVCSDDNRCTHEEMAGYAGEVYFANAGDPELDIEQVKLGAGGEDEVDHIYGWHTSPIPGAVTFTHFWNADGGRDAPSSVDGPASAFGPFANSWQKVEQYWSLALGAYGKGNTIMAYHFLGHIAHQMGDNTIPTHVHVSAHDPISGDDSFEDWMSQGNDSEPPGSDLLAGELEALSAAGPIEVPEIPGEVETPLEKLYWLLYTTNQIADFFPSDRAEGDTIDPQGWVQTELDAMAAGIATPRTAADLEDNDCNNPFVCIGGLPGDDDNNVDGDLGVIREFSYLRGIRAIAGLYDLFEQTVSTQPIVVLDIEKVEELDDHDYLCAPICVETSDADFYSKVSIDGLRAQNEGDALTGEVVHPNWLYGQTVETSGSIPIWIEIWDEDNLQGDDDNSNITAGPGRRLDFSLDLAKCLSVAGDAVTGAGITGGGGACDQSLTTDVTADDDDDVDGISRVTFSVTIFEPNLPPTADAGGPYTVGEGDSVGLSGAGSSDPEQATASLTFEWDLDNDGSYDNFTGISPSFSAAGLDGPASRTVGLRVTDDGGLTDTDTATVMILNVEPTITSIAVSSTSMDEGESVSVTGTFVDPALGVSTETFSGSAVWSDGASTPLAIAPGGTFETTRSFPDDDPSGTPSDDFTVVITIDDDDLGSDSATSPVVTVNDVAPTLTLGTVATIDENGVATLDGTIADPGTLDTFTLDINWGDLLSPENTQTILLGEDPIDAGGVTWDPVSRAFSVVHQYLDDNPTATSYDTYTIAVTLADDDSLSDSKTMPVVVKNVAPVLTGAASDATFEDRVGEGEWVTVSAVFTDIGTLDTHTASIDWDDGMTTSGTIIESEGSGTVTASHPYVAGGIYTITVTLTDDDKGSHSADTTAVITGVGLNDGVLFVVGTAAGDQVSVNQQDSRLVKVHADLLPEGFRTFDVAEVDSIIAYLFEGDDHMTIAGNVRIPAILHGGDDNDHLFGGGGPSVLLGDAGNDTLAGGPLSRNVLIGGLGADRLRGGSNEDLLIGGSTSYDADDAALMDLLDEWNDGADYAVRVDRLRTGTGATGIQLAAGATVFDDTDTDVLTGSADRDWFFFDTLDDVTGLKDNEETN